MFPCQFFLNIEISLSYPLSNLHFFPFIYFKLLHTNKSCFGSAGFLHNIISPFVLYTYSHHVPDTIAESMVLALVFLTTLLSDRGYETMPNIIRTKMGNITVCHSFLTFLFFLVAVSMVSVIATDCFN